MSRNSRGKMPIWKSAQTLMAMTSGIGRRKIRPAHLPRGFPEIHVHDDPEVVVDGHDAVQHADDGQPVVFGLDGGAQDVKFPHESRQGRNARQREEENRHRQGDQGMPARQARVVFDPGVAASFCPRRMTTVKAPMFMKV